MVESKKEKGTVNSTLDSVKNQLQVNKYKTNSLQLIQKIEKNLIDLKFESIDSNQLRLTNNTLSFVSLLKGTMLKDPRYPYQVIQSAIDELYSRDNQILGVTLRILFKEIKNNLKNFNPNVKGISK